MELTFFPLGDASVSFLPSFLSSSASVLSCLAVTDLQPVSPAYICTCLSFHMLPTLNTSSRRFIVREGHLSACPPSVAAVNPPVGVIAVMLPSWMSSTLKHTFLSLCQTSFQQSLGTLSYSFSEYTDTSNCFLPFM